MLVFGGRLCPGTSINDRQADRTPGQPLTKSCSPCPQPGVPSPRRWRAESPPVLRVEDTPVIGWDSYYISLYRSPASCLFKDARARHLGGLHGRIWLNQACI